ncbi:hypothetical protein Q4566_14960 [Tamlana sp. 2_MG-2023]|uniref:hypothetical protein n=1 Tax=unclassified Tamlana TaxID=2614803 RepID=UPI0026E19A5F|nr:MULTISPECIES: hypothetical protein [unclassified Tamlana]MDO6761510.1 hypothetical protein [Tamlana sp. 2_MG-2023]MDO6792396.1 hypothetical protein [Tamlana sp. 1_MG-2023]
MIEFLHQNYLYLALGVEFLAAAIGLLLYKHYAHTAAKYFIIFLVYIFIVDLLGVYTHFVKENKVLSFLLDTVYEKNYWLFTLTWDIGAVLFYSLYYRKILQNRLSKIIVVGISILFFLFSLMYITSHWNSFFTGFYDSIIVFGGFVIVVCTSLYFIEILLSEKILYFYKDLNFYISVAIFVWWIVITPLTFYDVYYTYEVGSKVRDWDYVHLRHQIYILANLFMYLTFTFALIWCKPPKQD